MNKRAFQFQSPMFLMLEKLNFRFNWCLLVMLPILPPSHHGGAEITEARHYIQIFEWVPEMELRLQGCFHSPRHLQITMIKYFDKKFYWAKIFLKWSVCKQKQYLYLDILLQRSSMYFHLFFESCFQHIDFLFVVCFKTGVHYVALAVLEFTV